jgi:lipid-binding SYLF domain-containing protein
MSELNVNALQWIVAALLAAPAFVQARDTGPAKADTTVPADRQSAAAERHVIQAVNVVRQLDMDIRIRTLLAASKGVFLIPSYVRAAVGVGAEGGAGLLLLRTSDGGWLQPVFYNTGGLSLGLQAGAEGGMLAFVLNNQKAVDAFLKKNNVSLSATAGLTVINWNRMVQASAGAGDVIAWSDSKGLFGNVATVELNGVRYNQSLTNACYHQTLSASDIVGAKTSNPQASLLVQALAASTAAH